tara:strand:- start:40 stop:264 length:225 start_codon:yes stop_codon:yes gene_type:complete
MKADESMTVTLTPRELELVMTGLQAQVNELSKLRPIPRVACKIGELEDLLFDLHEISARGDGDWNAAWDDLTNT